MMLTILILSGVMAVPVAALSRSWNDRGRDGRKEERGGGAG